jgi:hypothetical protein
MANRWAMSTINSEKEACAVCNWKECPLNSLYDEKFKLIHVKLDDNKAFEAQHFQLNELAIKKAEDSMTVRLDNMNEFRAQLASERGLLATKEQVDGVKQQIIAYTENNAKLLEAFKQQIAISNENQSKRISAIELVNAESKGKASVEDVKKVSDSASSAKLLAILGTSLAIIAALVTGLLNAFSK